MAALKKSGKVGRHGGKVVAHQNLPLLGSKGKPCQIRYAP